MPFKLYSLFATTFDRKPTHSPDVGSLFEAGAREFKRKIVAVGDLHGDMHNAQTVLEMAGVVNSGGHWTGEVDLFVQTGDIIDR